GGVEFRKSHYVKTYGFDEADFDLKEEKTGTGNEDKGTRKTAAEFAAHLAPRTSHLDPAFPDQQLIDTLCSLVTPEMMQQQMSPVLQPVIKGLQESGNPDEAMAALMTAFPDMDTANMDKLLGNLMFIAEAIGRVSAGDEE